MKTEKEQFEFAAMAIDNRNKLFERID